MNMPPSSGPDQEFVELVQRVLNHEASLDDIKILNDRLPRDPDALRHFVEMRLLHGELEDHFGNVSGKLDSIDDRVVRFSTASAETGPISRSRTWRRAVVAVAAIVVIGFTFLGVDRLLHPPAFEVVARYGTALATVPEKGTWIRSGDRLELGDSVVEVRSADGNSLTLQGPGILEIRSQSRINLQSGRLWAELVGEPMRIQVPRGEIADLGTTFGIDQSSPSATRVDVFDGEVEFSKASGSQNSVRAVKGESLTSDGADWMPEKGEADASRYTLELRRPLGLSFAKDDSEAKRIRSGFAFGVLWSPAVGPSGSIRLGESPVEVAWAGSNLYHTGSAESPEAVVLATHLSGHAWSGDHQVRQGEAKALGLPGVDGGIVIRVRHLQAWLDRIGAKGYRLEIHRNAKDEDVRFLPVSVFDQSPSEANPLLTITAGKSDHLAADFPDGPAGNGARLLQKCDEVLDADRIHLVTRTQTNPDDPNRGNVSGVILVPVF